MSQTTSAALLQSLTAMNTATEALVQKVIEHRQSRDGVIDWLKADIELLTQMRKELDGNDDAVGCQNDPLASALDAAISTKCVALAALNEEEPFRALAQ